MHDSAKKKILLVEDEAIIAQEEAWILENFGYSVQTVYSGANAVKAAADDIDLILMDIDLGAGMNGTEAARQILKNRDIPIVFLTSHAEQEMVDLVHGITRYGYIIKNSGEFVLRSSIEMAFELFDAHTRMRENADSYRILFENSLNAVGLHEIILDDKGVPVDYIFLEVNAAFEKHTGLRACDIINKRVTEVYPGIEKSDLIRIYGKVTLTGISESFETFFEPSQCFFHINVYQAGYHRFAVVFENITERKLVEETLLKRNAEMMTELEAALDGILIVNAEGKIDTYNNQFMRMWQIPDTVIQTHSDELAIQSVLHLLVDPDEFIKKIDYLYAHHNEKIRDQIILTDGRIFDRYSVPINSYNNHYYGRIWFFRDITAYKRLEKESENNRLLLQAILDHFPGLITIKDLQGKIRMVNRNYNLLAVNRDYAGKTVFDLFSKETADALWKNHQAAVKAGGMGSFEEDLPHKDGSWHTYMTLYFPLYPVKNNEITLLGIIRTDITDTKQVLKNLEKTKILLQASIESPQNLIILALDREYRYIYFNRVHREGMRNAYNSDIQIGRCIFDYITSEADRRIVKENYNRTLAGEAHCTIDVYGELKKDYYENFHNPIYNEKNEIIGITVYARNITARIESEQQIKQLLTEKEFLLKEVYHRTRNNINTLISLLTLQSHFSGNAEAKNVLLDARNRVYSMLMLYDKLHSVLAIHESQVREYLAPLCDGVVSVFPLKVTLEKQIADFTLNTRLLFPVGMIVNELLTNAMKYAFPGRESGIIRITVNKQENHIVVIIHDNGVGIPVLPGKQHGFGHMLIRVLTEQLNGSFRIEQEQGTKCILEFDANPAVKEK